MGIFSKSFNKNEVNICRDISPEDAMFDGDVDHYFSVSSSAMKCINIALSICDKKEIKTILDLPCGHGRVLRSLVAYFPNAEITACDLDRKAVDYCARAFNVRGVYSNKNFTADIVEGKFDLIWCGSLLTHLDANNAIRLLDFLIEKLEKDGILLITSHGRFFEAKQKGKKKFINDISLNKILKECEDAGHGYCDYENQNGYGLSMSKASWMISYVEKREDVRVLYFTERLWDDHQDVLALIKKPIYELRLRDLS